MVHVPVLRHGEVYRSLDVGAVPAVGRGEPTAEASIANAGLVRRDTRRLADARAALAAIPAAELVRRTVAAGEHFVNGTLSVGDDPQTPDDYVRACAASTGLPEVMVRANMDKLAFVLANMETVIRGLTRGLDLSVFDEGIGEQDGIPVAIVSQTDALGAVLPSNSPGVHSLWLPAPALKTPVVLKPGSGDPWTPLRLIEAMIAAGIPREAFGFYPGGHDVGTAIVDTHDRILVFGGADTVRRYASRPGVSVHGPGNSKVLLGPDADWREHLDLMATSVARNGGRSCINASTIVVPRDGEAVARALADRLAALEPTSLDDPTAGLAAFADARVAHAIDEAIDGALEDAGATDVSGGPRVAEVDGLTYLRPTVVLADADHALADREYPFPFVAVVEAEPYEALQTMGPTLVLSLVGQDPELRRRAMAARQVDRVHFDDVPTTAIRWDQPHEGNLFEWLYRRRAVAF
jgi:hypothetical protein